MNVTVTSENKAYTFIICGRIDTLTAPELEAKFREIEADAEKVVFDMTEVDYISSAGMRTIIYVQKTNTSQPLSDSNRHVFPE